MCFTALALVTDDDAGVEGETGVTHDEVLAVFARNIEGLKGVLTDAIEALPPAEPDDDATCPCRRALDGLTLPFALPT
jgi:5'-methylthioadenosine phosphorylase